MLMRFWSEISRMFLCMFSELVILRPKKCVFYKSKKLDKKHCKSKRKNDFDKQPGDDEKMFGLFF